jgi:hypothetical protein
MMSSMWAEMTLRSFGGWVCRRGGVGPLLGVEWGVDRVRLRGRWLVGRRTWMSCSSVDGVSVNWTGWRDVRLRILEQGLRFTE